MQTYLLRSLADPVWQRWTGGTLCPNMSGDISCSKDRTEWHEGFNLSGSCFISLCCGAVSYRMWTSATIAFWVSGYQWKIVNEKYSSHNKCLDKNMMYFKRNVPNILYMYRNKNELIDVHGLYELLLMQFEHHLNDPDSYRRCCPSSVIVHWRVRFNLSCWAHESRVLNYISEARVHVNCHASLQ